MLDGCELLQFCSVGLAKAARVGTIQNHIRRRGEGGLASVPVIQCILQGSTDGACLLHAFVRQSWRRWNRRQNSNDRLSSLCDERKLFSILRKGSDETTDNRAHSISITSLRAWNFISSLSFRDFLRRISCCFSMGSSSIVALASCSLSSARRFSFPFSVLFSRREICRSSPVRMLRFWERAPSLFRSSLRGRRAVLSFVDSVVASAPAV